LADFRASPSSPWARRAARRGRKAGSDQGFVGGGQQGWSLRATRVELAAAEEQVAVQPDLACQRRQRAAVDERGAVSGQPAFIGIRQAVIEEAADDQAQDRVAQELEPFVVARDELGILVRVGSVDERLNDGVGVGEDDAESLTQLADGG
jgi:hypothetical protein